MRGLSGIVLCLGLLVSGAAYADNVEKAKSEMKAGGSSYDAGKYEDALKHFKKALEYAPSASGPHREMGKAYQQLAKYKEARASYEKYLELKPDADDSDEIRGLLAEVKKKLPADDGGLESPFTEPATPAPDPSKPALLSISVNVSGAKISIDGKSIGKAPLSGARELSPGKHTVAISKRGYEDFTQEIDAAGGESLTIDAALVEVGKSEATTPINDKLEKDPEDGGGKGKGVALLTGGVVAAAGGSVAGFLALEKKKEIEDLVDQPVEFLDFAKLRNQGRLFNVLTVAGYTLGAAGVTFGIISLAKGGKERSAKRGGAQVALFPTAGGGAAQVTVQF
jgi:tetratricopeptide (TPR) repeat protein